MYVVATAGHVDHGKSTLVRTLTGMEPDRFAEERRRGMTIDLGYAWTTLPTGESLAFVDVPGHQRFIANMLAGLGPAPAVLFVVAADKGWSRQSTEHLAAADALGVRHGVLAITRSDRADPSRAADEARTRLRSSTLGDLETVAVSGLTADGVDDLTAAMSRMLRRLPVPDPAAAVRFWVDRSFTVRGAGTIVTGTLSSGRITTGDILTLSSNKVTIRGIQCLGSSWPSIGPVSRVALNLRGVAADEVGRGDVLLAPDRFHLTLVLDVRVVARPKARFDAQLDRQPDEQRRLPAELVLHAGTAAVPVHVRPLGGDVARLTLRRALPLRAGDRAVLRDPGRQSVAAGVLVLDADPPDLRRRGAARLRAAVLADAAVPPDPAVEIARRGSVARRHLDRLGVDTSALPDTDGWLVSPGQHADWVARAPAVVAAWAAEHPLDPAIPRVALRQTLGVPDEALLGTVLADAGFAVVAGRVGRATVADLGPAEAGLTVLLARLRLAPFAAPERDELRELGLGRREVAAAVRAGRLMQVADGIVLLPDAPERAVAVLRTIEAPFTLSAARLALDTTRRVAVPLLEYCDSRDLTVRDKKNTRSVTPVN